MNYIKNSKVTITALSILIGSVLLTGCAAKPAPKHKAAQKKTVKTVKELKPAALYIDEKAVDTRSKIEDHSVKIDKTIYLNNTTHRSAVVKLTNKGDEVLNIQNIDFDNKKLFSLSSTCKQTLASKESCDLKITFNGKQKGEFKTLISVSSNSTGVVGNLGKIEVIATSDNIIRGVFTKVTTHEKTVKKPMLKFNFPKEGTRRIAILKNDGLEDIKINSFELINGESANFSYDEKCPTVLKTGESCEISFVYAKRTDVSALAFLKVKSNGVLFPSDTIRLSGRALSTKFAKNAPALLKIAEKDDIAVIPDSINVKENTYSFLEDFSAVKPTFYIRTMYQGKINSKLKENYEQLIRYYFEKNGYKLTKNAVDADKILNIYPEISFKKEKDTLVFNANIDVRIVTKSGKVSKTDEKILYEMKFTLSDYSDEYLAFIIASDKINSFMFNLLGLED